MCVDQCFLKQHLLQSCYSNFMNEQLSKTEFLTRGTRLRVPHRINLNVPFQIPYEIPSGFKEFHQEYEFIKGTHSWLLLKEILLKFLQELILRFILRNSYRSSSGVFFQNFFPESLHKFFLTFFHEFL